MTVIRRIRASSIILVVLSLSPMPALAEACDEACVADFEQRIAALEEFLAAEEIKLANVTVDENNDVIFNGVNVLVQSGSGFTDGVGIYGEEGFTVNGNGNVIVGYDEAFGEPADEKIGSHNIILGRGHTYKGYASLLGGEDNLAEGCGATTLGGFGNKGSDARTVTLGGEMNDSNGRYSVIIGGQRNVTTPKGSIILGGRDNQAGGDVSGTQTFSGKGSAILGGAENSTERPYSAVLAGFGNLANGKRSAITGGSRNVTDTDQASVGGGVQNVSRGINAAVAGGRSCEIAIENAWGSSSSLEQIGDCN